MNMVYQESDGRQKKRRKFGGKKKKQPAESRYSAEDLKILSCCEDLDPDQADLNEADRLVRKFYGALIQSRINNAVWRRLFNRQVQEELFQDVMVALVPKSLRRFKRQSKLSHYIATIANRTCISRIRKMKRFELRAVFTEDLQRADGPAFELPDEDPEDLPRTIERNEHVAIIHRSFDQLTKREQEVMRMRYREDMEYAEIAARLDVTVSYVGKVIHGAKKKIVQVAGKILLDSME